MFTTNEKLTRNRKKKKRKMLFYTVVACILAFSNLAVCESEPEIKIEGGVLVLTQENFLTAIKENAHVLVEFCK